MSVASDWTRARRCPPPPPLPSRRRLRRPPAPVAAPVAPAVATPIKLVVEADNYVFDLTGKSEIAIGREDAVSNIYPDVDLTTHGGEEGGVSRLHAKIYIRARSI